MDYFYGKIRRLTNQLPNEGINPLIWLQRAMESWDDRRKLLEFHFKDISLLQTIKYIGDMGNSTSYGRDSIDALAIKSAAQHLAPPIRHLINTSLGTSEFAIKWKYAKLIPLLKDKDMNKLTPTSYRPIAILPTALYRTLHA